MGTISYSSVESLAKYLGIYKTIPNKDSTTLYELVGTGDAATSVFWLDNLGVLSASYTILGGNTEAVATALVENTEYTFDIERSKVSLTSSGITTVNTGNVYAQYDYNGEEFLNSELTEAIRAAEVRIESWTEQKFADGTAADPGYRKVTNEILKGHYLPEGKVYELYHSPIVKIQTTVNGAYTTGGSTITLTSGTGLPNAGTIYIGGNKVSYTARSGNDITVPTATPSIDDGATVRGEVIELSKEPEGTAPSYTVLVPDTEYEIDYFNGRVKLLSNAFFGEIDATDRIYPSNYLVRVSYFQAWHELNGAPFIPDEIKEVTNMLAAQRFIQRIINKAYVSGMNEFDPTKIEQNDEEIMKILEYYRPLNVTGSMYDKQSLT